MIQNACANYRLESTDILFGDLLNSLKKDDALAFLFSNLESVILRGLEEQDDTLLELVYTYMTGPHHSIPKKKSGTKFFPLNSIRMYIARGFNPVSAFLLVMSLHINSRGLEDWMIQYTIAESMLMQKMTAYQDRKEQMPEDMIAALASCEQLSLMAQSEAASWIASTAGTPSR